MVKDNALVRVGISCGDLNGIGLEVVIGAFQDNRMMQHLTPIVYASSKTMQAYRKLLGMSDFRIFSAKDASLANPKRLNLVNVWDEEVKLKLGTPSGTMAKYAIQSLDAATQDLASHKIDVLVTAPIHKDTMQEGGFEFPGHTEYLAHLSNEEEALMLMCNEALRVGVVTGHIPLKEVSKTVTTELVLNKLHIMYYSLMRDFGIRKPRIAVMGLNPHAGEQGRLGEEDGKIIVPAIERARKDGMMVIGPYAVDGFFGSGNWKNFDGILAMYHDQGLAPFKALSFGNGVNYTAGLPIVRTSPDHGTGYEIAGKGVANPDSFRTACFLARDIFLNRRMHKEITANPLQPQKQFRQQR